MMAVSGIVTQAPFLLVGLWPAPPSRLALPRTEAASPAGACIRLGYKYDTSEMIINLCIFIDVFRT